MQQKVQVSKMRANLAFDTEVLRRCARQYGGVAKDIRSMADELDRCLEQLANSGWTTNAGKAFHKMTEVNWRENMEKYAGLIDTLEDILTDAAGQYETLASSYIEKTRL